MNLGRLDAVYDDVLQLDLGPMCVVEAGDQHVTRRLADYIFNHDLLVIGDLRAGVAGIDETLGRLVGVVGRDGDGVRDVAHTDVFVGQVVVVAAAGDVALDADAVVV